MPKHLSNNIESGLFFHPDATVEPSSKIPVAKTADDINEMFKELDDKPDKAEKPEKKTSEPEEDEPEVKTDEDEDDELELKEPEEDLEKLDLKEEDTTQIDAPPRKKEILAKYPDLFKSFPFLEKMMYRDKQYTELFGSFDDAKEIAEQKESFEIFEKQLLSGNTEEILKELKETDENAFKLIVDDYLGTLHKVDKDSYFHVVGNMNRRLIMEMVQEAENSGNEDLKNAALMVNQFVFGNSKFTAPSRLVEKPDEKKVSETEKERLEFVRERFETSRDDLQSQVDNTLRATITDYIDPKGRMSAYEKKNAVNDAMNYLAQAISNDAGTAKNLKRLWEGAFEAKFSKDSLGKIKSYYLSRAKANLRDSIIKARAEALKDSSPKREKDDDEEPQPRAERRITTGRISQPTKRNEMKKGESVADFFARD